ncbi:high frequency lysogenization protein HflD [Planctobacterium marinum]|uniref:High frequency lysogenization protein HflD homolog n=1 Tax=Planctobacterium marinum TaxID=1631968 RepID=A0AA48HMB0_9ALTE|nr:high frequency lysogenization protein HflD [Planctobacterium marinum]
MNRFDEAQLALAGVCQAAYLVKAIARSKPYSEDAYEATLSSIVKTDPDSTLDVYGALKNLKFGFEVMVSQLSDKAGKDQEITRYVASLLTLERKLSGSDGKLAEIGQRIDNIKRQTSMMSLFEGQMVSNLASIYKDNISPLTHKIQVAGDPTALKQQSVQDKVRALLLAGIRSAVLWRQLGGKRRNIIFQRNKILNSAENTLKTINQTF